MEFGGPAPSVPNLTFAVNAITTMDTTLPTLSCVGYFLAILGNWLEREAMLSAPRPGVAIEELRLNVALTGDGVIRMEDQEVLELSVRWSTRQKTPH